MGNLQAQEMVAHTDIDTALSWHLKSNHFPPLPDEIFNVAKEVIEGINADDGMDFEVELPEGCTYRGSPVAPAWACVEAWHLDAFLEVDDGEY